VGLERLLTDPRFAKSPPFCCSARVNRNTGKRKTIRVPIFLSS
jgi:hypothetical protein